MLPVQHPCGITDATGVHGHINDLFLDLRRWSCTRPLRIIPLPLKPATMPRLTILERGQGHGFTPFLLPTRSVGPRVALRHAAYCRVWPRGSNTADSDAHQAQAHTLSRAPTVGRPEAQTALCPV